VQTCVFDQQLSAGVPAMTFGGPHRGPGHVRRFRGSKGRTAANRLSHGWIQVRETLRPENDHAVCGVCGADSRDLAADWPCGAPERLGPGECER
jgi:hypothetical protein